MGRTFFGLTKFGSEIFLGQQNLGQKKFESIFLLHESPSWVKIGLHAKNQLSGWSGRGLKVCRGGGGGLQTHNLVKPT